MFSVDIRFGDILLVLCQNALRHRWFRNDCCTVHSVVSMGKMFSADICFLVVLSRIPRRRCYVAYCIGCYTVLNLVDWKGMVFSVGIHFGDVQFVLWHNFLLHR